MFAKVKNNEVLKFPYGYDEFQQDNPYTLLSGEINLMELFPKTEEALLNGCELVNVKTMDKPTTHPLQEAVLADVPVFQDGEWVLLWSVSIKVIPT